MSRLLREYTPVRRGFGKPAILVITVASFAAGMWIGPSQPSPRPEQQDTASAEPPSTTSETIVQYDRALAKRCLEIQGVLVMRVLEPNGLECAHKEWLLPLGPAPKGGPGAR